MTVTRLLIVLVPAAALAAGNYVVARTLTAPGPVSCLACVAWLVGAPLLFAVVLAATLTRATGRVVVERTAAPPPAPAEEAALRLLGLLQEEGRLVDFLEEDLSGYPDAQVGAAARGIHEGCRKALRARVTLEPVLRGAEGDGVTVEPGFDPAAIRLTGNVSGVPPFRGVLRHPGWRVTATTLPPRRGLDPHVIAPAEVEIA
jgi:hypothetical protein